MGLLDFLGLKKKKEIETKLISDDFILAYKSGSIPSARFENSKENFDLTKDEFLDKYFDALEELDIDKFNHILSLTDGYHYKDYRDKTAMHRLLEYEVEILPEQGKIIEMYKRLLELGLDINERDCFDRTPLQYINPDIFNGDFLNIIISLVANIKTKDEDGKTLLHHLCIVPRNLHHNLDNRQNVINTFVELGLDINKKDKYDNTPLAEAVHSGLNSDNTELVSFLIALGAKPDITLSRAPILEKLESYDSRADWEDQGKHKPMIEIFKNCNI